MKEFVYADNAATTRLAPEALEAMMPFLTDDYSNASQPYSFSRSAKAALRSSRETISRCIGAEPEEIFFTSGGTESDNWAIKSSSLSDKESAIITTSFEHHAILNSCASLERMGHNVLYVSPNTSGIIEPSALERALTTSRGLVSVIFANNELGTIQDIKTLAAISHEHGSSFHSDAVQAVGHISIDVRSLCVDILSSSAHKYNGPKGVGFLYVRRGMTLPAFADGGAQEMGMRAGTENIAGVVGMATALAISCQEMQISSARLRRCEAIIMDALRKAGVDFIRNGAEVSTLPGVMSLSFKDADGEALLHRLDLMGICVSTGSACDGSNTEISHVLRAIALAPEYARGTIRVSLGRYNTEEDAAKIGAALVKIFEAR